MPTFDSTLPAVGSNYSTVFVPKILEHQLALASWFESTYVTAYTNPVTGIKRLEGGLIQEWNGTAWAEKTVGYAKKAGDTFTGKIITKASAAGGAGLNLPHGAAPTTPTNGDMWTTTAATFVRLNGATKQLVDTAGTGATGTWAISVSGNSATATTAAACSGNAATATTAADCSGNAATATKLATARTFTFTGDVSGSTTFDGSANFSVSLAVADDSHAHTIGFIAGLQAALDAKAPLASPEFTGIVKAPTRPAGDSSPAIATTAFVGTAVSNAVTPLAPKSNPVFAGQVQAPAGAYNAPGIYFAGAAGMGLYAVGTTSLGFSVGGATAATLTSSAFTATGNVTAYSDERLKTDFRRKYLTSEEIRDIEHFVYRRRDSGIFQIGVKAQAVRKHLPLAVEEDENHMLSVDYGRLGTALALSLARVLDGLEDRVAELEKA